MYINIHPSKLKGEVEIPSAKAYAHRYILASLLSHSICKLKGKFEGEDIEYTLKAVENLGVNVYRNIRNEDNCINEIILDNNHNDILNNTKSNRLTIDVGESGSTFRFLMPICAALGKDVYYIGKGRIYERPVKELCAVLNDNGISFDRYKMPFCQSGKLHSGEYKIDPTISSQYITGLLFALPILDGDSKIILTKVPTSKPYINMTIEVLSQYGISIQEKEYGYYVPGNQIYKAPKEIIVEADWSSAGYFALLGAYFGDIILNGLKKDSNQGDKRIIDILKEMSADIEYKNNSFIFKKSKLKSIDVDVTDIPDMAPLLACAFIVSEGQGRLFGVDRLKYKESDRLQSIFNILENEHVDYCYNSDNNGTIVINGQSNCKNAHEFSGCMDHRIVMCETVLSLMLNKETKIYKAQSVNKSFPSFFKVLKLIGGRVEENNEYNF